MFLSTKKLSLSIQIINSFYLSCLYLQVSQVCLTYLEVQLVRVFYLSYLYSQTLQLVPVLSITISSSILDHADANRNTSMAVTFIPFIDQLKNYLSLSYKMKRAVWKLRPKRALSQPVYTRCHLVHLVYSVLLLNVYGQHSLLFSNFFLVL